MSSPNEDVPAGVPDPGKGGQNSGENVEDAIRMPHVDQGTSFVSGIKSALGFGGASSSAQSAASEGATKNEEESKLAPMLDKVSDAGASVAETTGLSRVGQSIASVAQSHPDAELQPKASEKRAMDSVANVAERASDSVTPTSVQNLKEKLGERLHSMSDAMMGGARTGADVPMPSTSGKDDLNRQQASSYGGGTN